MIHFIKKLFKLKIKTREVLLDIAKLICTINKKYKLRKEKIKI
jgi:hypothetical protein